MAVRAFFAGCGICFMNACMAGDDILSFLLLYSVFQILFTNLVFFFFISLGWMNGFRFPNLVEQDGEYLNVHAILVVSILSRALYYNYLL